MPAHYSIYMEICFWLQNILKINPKGMATFKKKNRNCNNFNILMVPVCFVKPVEQCKLSVDCLQFAISNWWRISSILFLKYLFINTYKALPVTWDYNPRNSTKGLYYLLQTSIDLNLITPNQPGLHPICYHCAMLHWQKELNSC